MYKSRVGYCQVPYPRGLVPRAFKLGKSWRVWWALRGRGAFMGGGGGGRLGGGGGAFNSISRRNLP